MENSGNSVKCSTIMPYFKTEQTNLLGILLVQAPDPPLTPSYFLLESLLNFTFSKIYNYKDSKSVTVLLCNPLIES